MACKKKGVKVGEDLKIMTKYQKNLSDIPPPGSGSCHVSLLGVANLGVMAGLHPGMIFQDIQKAIPTGTRKVRDKEIQEAINRAIKDHQTGEEYHCYTSPKPKIIRDGETVLQNIIKKANIEDEADLWESSPIRIDWPPDEDAFHFLSFMYQPDDLIFIGEHDHSGMINQNIKTAADWINFFKNGGRTSPFIIINPLTGSVAKKKSGDEETYRGDANVKFYRFVLGEFDNLSRTDQIRFWSAVKLPVVCLVDSGGKSIHAWIDIQINTADEWNTQIKSHLYEQGLIPLGVDRSCCNPARLSRLPGHYRNEKGKIQRLLWLAGVESEKEKNERN